MDFLKSLTDDQFALLCCAGALVASGTVMSLSYYIGRVRTATAGNRSGVRPMAATQVATAQTGSADVENPRKRRNAA